MQIGKNHPGKRGSRSWLLLIAGLLLMLQFCIATARESQPEATIGWHELPAEARHTVKLIRQGGPFPYPKDGTVFGNYERVLPKQKRGYYHEFTVKTPGMSSRGARRIVAGGDWKTTRELYYTANHYASFRRIKE
jgi:ribonuclease T1